VSVNRNKRHKASDPYPGCGENEIHATVEGPTIHLTHKAATYSGDPLGFNFKYAVSSLTKWGLLPIGFSQFNWDTDLTVNQCEFTGQV
jgi:hypothetical protein